MKRLTLYIDESGNSNLEENSPYFILTGIVVEEEVDKEISAYFNYVKRRHGLDQDRNFHAFEFFEEKKSSIYPTDAKSKIFTDSLCEFMDVAPFRVFLFAIKKQEVRDIIKMPKNYRFLGESHKEDKDFPYEILARKIFLPFADLLKKEKALGAIVAESRMFSDRNLLRTYISCHTKQNQTYISKKYQKYAEYFNTHVVSLKFENKNAMRGGLELADIYSFVLFQKLNKKVNKLKHRGIEKLYKVLIEKPLNRNYKKTFISKREMNAVIGDRIHKITNKIAERIQVSPIQP